MRRGPSLYPDKGISLERKRRITTSSEGSSSTRNESLQHPSEAFPLNTKGIRRCSAKRNHRDYPGIPFGIMPLSYSQEHPPRCLDYSFPSLKSKLPRHRNSVPNT